MTRTEPKTKLASLTTADLIAQYDLAISSHAGRYTDSGTLADRQALNSAISQQAELCHFLSEMGDEPGAHAAYLRMRALLAERNGS